MDIAHLIAMAQITGRSRFSFKIRSKARDLAAWCEQSAKVQWEAWWWRSSRASSYLIIRFFLMMRAMSWGAYAPHRHELFLASLVSQCRHDAGEISDMLIAPRRGAQVFGYRLLLRYYRRKTDGSPQCSVGRYGYDGGAGVSLCSLPAGRARVEDDATQSAVAMRGVPFHGAVEAVEDVRRNIRALQVPAAIKISYRHYFFSSRWMILCFSLCDDFRMNIRWRWYSLFLLSA